MATFTGTSGNDTLTGGDGDDSIDGLAGDDSINGGDGGDTLIGGLGNDSLFGGTGGDAFIADAGNDTLDGGAILVNFPRLESNKGIYTNSPAAVTVNLATGSAQDGWGGTDTLRNINFVFGSNFADQLTGGTAMIPELFSGGLGNDTIDGGLITGSGVSVANGNGGFGNSNLVFYTDSPAAVQVDLGLGSATGGGGNDRLININGVLGSDFADNLNGSNSTTMVEVFSGEAGNDTIDGGVGLDSATYVTASGAVNVNLTTGVASDGLGGTDTLLNIEAVFGSKNGDTLTGNSKDNLLWGDLGNDTLSGGAGNDTLKGEQGNDAIDGGNGWDQAVFSGNLSDYSVAFNPSLQTVTLTDNRTGNATNSGTDVLKNIDNFQFANTSKTLLGLVNALGQNYGVDLNGLSDGGLQRTYWMGPNQYYPDSNNVLQKQAGAGFWGAEVGLSGGVKAVRISTDQSASSIQSNAILDWTFGYYSGQTNPTTMRFADTTASAVSFTSNSKTFTVTPSTHITSGVTYYDLLIKASDGGLVDSEAVTNALTQIKLDYRSNVTQPAQEQFDVKLQVNISADLQNWVGASAGQTDTFIARMDNQGPLVAVANYSGRMVGLGFKNILGMGTGLPDASKDAWQAHPDKSYFNVTVDGKQAIVMDAVMMNDGVALLLGSVIPSTAREVMVSYTDPTGNQSTKVIEDWQGNDTPSFTIQALRNDALDFVGTIHSNAVLGYDTDGNSAAKYVSDDGMLDQQTLAKVTSVNGTSATMSMVASAWGINPGFSYKAGAAQDVTQFAYTKEKFDVTVVNPNGNTYALGSTVSLQDLINFNNGVKFTLFTAYVMASNSNTATDGTSFELARYSTSAPFPMWGLVTGFALGEGNFTINGGPGDDAITVNGPNGVAYGGAGNDTYWYTPIGNGEKYTIDDASGSADTLWAQLFDGFDMIPRGERIGNDLQFVGSASNMANAKSTLYIKNQYTTGTIENINLVGPQGDIQRTYQFVIADAGNDANNLMVGNSKANVLSGGAGDDMIFGSDGNDTLNGDSGDDLLYGGAGTNLLQGGLGNDGYQWDIAGGQTTDSISDSGGYDYLMMRLPSLMLDAERAGNDVLVSVVSNGVTKSSVRLVNQLTTGKVEFFNFVLPDDDWQFNFDSTNLGTTSGDWMVGTASADALNGQAGNDWLTGGAGNDTLTGGTGNDILMGGSGTDSLVGGAGNDKYLVTDSSDVISELTSDNTAAQLAFSMGNDNDVVIATVSYTLGSGVAVEDLMAAGNITLDFWSESAINLTGNELGQGVMGNGSNNVLRGMGGNDILIGLGGDDTLYGDDGKDCLMGGTGNDYMYGGAGDDWAIAFWGGLNGWGISGGAVTLVSTGGFDSADGGSGTDTLAIHGLQSQFTVTRLATDDYIITSLSDSTESMRFTGFEKISFGLITPTEDDLTQANPVVVNLPGAYVINPTDNTAPTITTFSPADDATGVGVASNIILTFSESVVARTGGTIELMTDYGSGHQSVEVFSVNDATRVTISGNVVRIDPTSALLPSTGYHLGFNSALADSAGNAFSYTHGQYNFTTVATSSGNLRGIAYDWKNHMLLKDVSVGATGGAAPVDAPIQFKGLTVDASGHATFEVWSHSTKAFENAGFEIEIPKATGITFTAGALPANAAGVSGWTVIVNADVSKLSMAGFATDTSYAVSAVDFKLGTLSFEMGTAQSGDLYLVGGDVGGAKASAYGVSAARTNTSVSGEFSFTALQSGTYDLSATRATTDIGSAVTSADALAALKLAVGINPNADPDGTGPKLQPAVSPYQFMAADVTGTDGRVTSADALAILKMAVKLPTAPAKEWMFVEESRDFWNETTSKFTLDRNNANWDHSISGVKVPGEANLVGVLKGDVNGSWTAPTDSLDLDTLEPTHFTALSYVFGMPVAQFGIV